MSAIANRKWLAAAILLTLVAAGSYWFLIRDRLHPERYDVRIVRYSIDSSLTHGARPQIALIPEGPNEDRPLLLFLHGRGMGPEGVLSDDLFAALEDEGSQAPIVVLPDGGEASYWHDRADGDWAAYLYEEVLPEADRRLPWDGSHAAVGGISMGGFGALNLQRLHSTEFCAVGAHSPALFERATGTPEGAFDDADDFRAHDLLALAREEEQLFRRAAIRVDAGTQDPFFQAARRMARSLARQGATFVSSEGGHDSAYWNAQMPRYVDFYATALEDCRGPTK